MSNRVPQVSVGMPVRNGERFLKESIESILGQTFEDFELLISDNASTDSTQEICRHYAMKDNRVRYRRNESNLGSAMNYNRLVNLANGRYFRWAPADDLFAPTSLERCVATLEANDDAVLCYPKTVLIDENGKTIGNYDDHLDLRSGDAYERFRRVLGVGGVNVIYGLLRLNRLRQTSLMGRYPAADQDLVIELSLYGRFVEIPEPLFFRRMHSGAFSAIKTPEGRREFWGASPVGRWRRYLRYCVFVMRAPIGWTARVRIAIAIARLPAYDCKRFVSTWLGSLQGPPRKRAVKLQDSGNRQPS